jgi:hypothetical protein
LKFQNPVSKFYFVGLTMLSAVTFVACTHATTKTSPSKNPSESQQNPTWSSRMEELRSTLSVLGPYLFDDKKFNDPSNFETIKTQTKKLGELAHTLDQSKKDKIQAPSSDPVLGYFASQFKENIGRAYESLGADHRDYARLVLRTSLSYCISCHTRSDVGPKFPLFDNPPFVSELQPMEQASYYVATRQYEPALKKYMDILQDPKTGQLRPFDIERAARSAMAIAVRVDRNADEALKIAKYVAQKDETPLFVKNDSIGWLQSIIEWKKEGKALPTTEAGFLTKIKSLLSKGQRLQRYRTDMKGDIYFLQATALIHEYFNRFESPQNTAEIMYLAGQSYEPLQELGFWTLHEMYYEKCVSEAPHTKLARKCYENLEQSIILGFSGSAGIFVPISVQKHLRELSKLSSPK